MNHKIFILIVLSFLGLMDIKAQDFKIAEDFTLTDIDGNTHNLYQYLDEGKTVFVELFATWCSSCWNHHQQGYMKQLWENRGPDATNDVMILMIENDINTPQAGIYGEGSFGNWAQDTPYPLFNVTTQAQASIFDVNSYPKFYTISPNRVITEFTGVHYVGNYEAIVDAALPAATQDSEIAILQYNGDTQYCQTLNTAITIQNLGLEPLTSAKININNSNNQVLSSFDWTGNLATYQIEVIELDDFDFNESAENLSFEAIPSMGGMGNYSQLSQAFERPTTTSDTILVEVQTDEFSFETYWAILDENDAIIAQGGNPEVGLNGGGLQIVSQGGYAPNSLNTEQIILTRGQCYQFVIIDDYADGICCQNGSGFFRISTPKAEILHINDGEFEDSFHLIFRIEQDTIIIDPEEEEEEEEPETTILAAAFSYEVAGNTVSFSNASTGSDIQNYTWSFGDGYYDFTANPAPHTYGGPGVYPVSLYISNANGSAYFNQNIVVGNETTAMEDIEFFENLNTQVTDNQLFVSFYSTINAAATLKIYAITGQIQQSKAVDILQGKNENLLDLTTFSSGTYILSIQTNTGAAWVKFVVL